MSDKTNAIVQKYADKWTNTHPAIRLVYALRTAVRADSNAACTRETFKAAENAESELIAAIEALIAAPSPSQPAQVGEWVKEAERLIADHALCVWRQARGESEVGALPNAEMRARAALLAHLRTRPAEDAGVLKDAERYRWLRQQHWSESAVCVVAEPKDAVKLGHFCPSLDLLDAAIDAAIEARLGAIGADNGGEQP